MKSKKRSASAPYANKPYQKPGKKAKTGAGYVRTGGFYGRFAGRGSELKFFDTALSFLVDSTGEVPATGQLSLIAQGTTESNRIGKKCVIRSITIKANVVFIPAAATVCSDNYAIFVVLDKQTNGAAAAVSDVFTGSSLPSALHNLANSQRFVVLKKIIRSIGAQAGVSAAYNNSHQLINFTKKCNIPLELSGTTGVITELRSNNIFLMAGSASQDDLITISGNCRLRFSDN